MSRIINQFQAFFGLRFRPVVAGSAKGNKVFRFVTLRYSPRDYVVNIKAGSFARQTCLFLSTSLAFVVITNPNAFGHSFPIVSALIVFGCSAFPVWMAGSRHHVFTRCNIARMRAESSWLTVEGMKIFSAMRTGLNCRFFATPSCFVVASHVTKFPRFSMIGECLKSLAATLTGFLNASARLSLAACLPAIPRWATICTGAPSRTIFSSGSTSEVCAAFGACVLNGFHSEAIPQNFSENKYFEIACKRVDEATRQPDLFVEPPKPEAKQEGFDI